MTTETATDTATISSKSRNLGYVWSNRFQSLPNGWEPFPLRAPGHRGGLRAIEVERARAHRINSGGQEWYEELFVGGRRITAYWGSVVEYDESEQQGEDEPTSAFESRRSYTVRDAWLRPSVGAIMRLLREGETLRVRLA